MNRKPVIGVSTDSFVIDGHPFHASGQKYLLPLIAMGAIPRLIPSFGPGPDVGDLLQDLDGLLLTGAVSNVEPRHYGGGPESDCPPYDQARDSTTLPLILATLERGLPLLAICRGHQELNVALGGSLFARVHEQPGRLDHRAPKGDAHEVQYAPSHPVALTKGGFLAGLAGDKEVIMVNSLHWQAIDRLGQGLAVEAMAPDGTIEAVRVEAAKSFAIGVQWHPEWRFAEDEVSAALFAAFSAAVHRPNR
jgi:putative glutamine amidotransferase